MLKKLMMAAGAGLLALTFAGAASAATLAVNDGNDHYLSNFGLTAETNLSDGDKVKIFDGTWLNGIPNTGTDWWGNEYGLVLDGAPAQLKFEYLGSEAGDENVTVFSQGGSEVIFNNKSGSNPSVVRTVNSDGLVPFYFRNEDKEICFFGCWNAAAPNTGWIDSGLSLAFFQESATSVIALFGDGAGDFDIDDMAIRISVVPLPPALALFAGALAGLGWLSRRRKGAATA